ncbi:hypothetical protein GGR55DRAFT_495579 [Xylaria sp. FL0064]|nr:hypothetical protein GGR55DRAFT_495579 [Xylaria sp. FL0064]
MSSRGISLTALSTLFYTYVSWVLDAHLAKQNTPNSANAIRYPFPSALAPNSNQHQNPCETGPKQFPPWYIKEGEQGESRVRLDPTRFHNPVLRPVCNHPDM